MRKFAISDIHGHALTFRALVENHLKLTKTDSLYLLGDYVDRGPDSRGVFDFVFELREAGYQVHCLRGNHEALMLDAILEGEFLELWIMNGGQATLDSFEVDRVDKVPGKYLQFLNELPYYFEVDHHILVHAGLNFKETNPLTPSDHMIWIRNWYEEVNYSWLGRRKIVHGHTPTPAWNIKRLLEQFEENRYLNIDCGCFWDTQTGAGQLCAYELTEGALYFQEKLEEE